VPGTLQFKLKQKKTFLEAVEICTLKHVVKFLLRILYSKLRAVCLTDSEKWAEPLSQPIRGPHPPYLSLIISASFLLI